MEIQQLQFRDLKLGYADAESEASRNPSLLIEGFLNLDGVIEELRSGERFLVIGNKGTGKTAIAEHLKFSSNSTTFVKIADLATFPYNDLKQIVEDEHAEPALPSAWSWLLLVSMLASFASDNGGNVDSDEEIRRIYDALDSVGLLPSAGNLKELLGLSRKRHFRVDLPFGIQLDADEERAKDLHLPFFVEKLKSSLLRFESRSTHLLVIDGLDEVLNLADSHLEPISGLVSESFRINSAFQKSRIPAKIILLCRTDLFDRLPGSNTNKIRQDSSIRLNWFTPEPKSSPLWTVANLRARLQTGVEVDIAKTYLPPKLQRTEPGSLRVLPWNAAETSQYLLRHTRFTPRDFVALLRCIQKEAKGVMAQQEEIANALQEYATDYFLPEIRNELSGYCSTQEIDALVDAFGLIRDSRFSLGQLEEIFPEGLRQGLPKILGVLFDCSAIGNWEDGEKIGGIRTYRYKNRNSRLDLHAVMSLHPALGLAFNALESADEDSGSEFGVEYGGATSRKANELVGVVNNAQEGYGFITDEKGEPFHYRRSDVIDGFIIRLSRGDKVTFMRAPRKDPRHPHFSALNVRRIKKDS